MPYIECCKWVKENFLIPSLNDLSRIDQFRKKYLNQLSELLVKEEIEKNLFVNEYEFDFSLPKSQFVRQLCIDFTYLDDDNPENYLDEYTYKFSRFSKNHLVIAFSWVHRNWMEFELGCMGKSYTVIPIILKLLKKGIWNKSSEAKLAAILHAENDGIFSDVMEIPDNISRSKYRFKYKFNEIFPNKPNG